MTAQYTCVDQTFSRLLAIVVDEKKALCTQSPRTGPCRASFTHWYYDPLIQKCSRFTFGGCDGNDNNFKMEDECTSTCQGVTEADVFARSSFERQEEEESRSGSVALVVVLCVAIMILLAVLGYCFLKNKKDRSQHLPVPTTVPNDTTVYHSTTKPI
ncbi:hypothetical protein UPYG_G00276540 [Umbra pygmaea]|uniref:BPTI/Kunitz inhibitor domain-containing protein n=1 Tax=Umbra pygmaea TaxID=75934 RepID=A0ABD0W3C5_UMBPY